MNITIGTIFECSWGYEQTNVDFYEVVKVTKASVKIRPIASLQESADGRWSGQSRPRPGVFTGEAQTRRIKNWRGTPSVRISSYSWAYLWDGKPKNYTSYA